MTNEVIEIFDPSGSGESIVIPAQLVSGVKGNGGTLFACYRIPDKQYYPFLQQTLKLAQSGPDVFWISQTKFNYHYHPFKTVPEFEIDKNRVWCVSPKTFVEQNNDSRDWLDLRGCCFQGRIEDLVRRERKIVIEPDFPDGNRGIFKVMVNGIHPAYLFRWFFDSGEGLTDNVYEKLSRGLCILEGDKDNLEYALDCYENNVVIF